jgi:trigger factor
LAKTDIDLPRILVESELDRMMHQVKTDVENSGYKFDEYMKHLNKTEEEMKKEWEGEAEKRAKLELLLQALAKAEGIKIDEKEIEQEVGRIMDMYKDADPMRARSYIENILKNEKIFQLLENYI